MTTSVTAGGDAPDRMGPSLDLDPFLAQLAELCRENRTGVKWVFVPSRALGHTLGERLALSGTDWANLRFTTPLDVALQMAAPFLVERGIEPAADTIGPALIMRFLLDLPDSVPSYFRDLGEHPRMAEALWATIRELRMAGLTSTDLRCEAFASAAKHAELRALLAAHETHLAETRRADTATVYQEALQHLDLGPVLDSDVRTELPGVTWAPLERGFFDELPGSRLVPRTLRLPGLVPSRRPTGATTLVDPVPTADSDLLAFVLKPADAPAPNGDHTLTMFRAGGREAEVEEVVRRILCEGLRFDQVEVTCVSADDAVLFWEKAQRHDWPVTIGPGVPVTLTRPARALLAFCDWVEAGFPSGGLRRLLQSGDIRLDLEDGPTAGQAARLLARSDATWGRQTYRLAMDGVVARYRECASDPEAEDEVKAHAALRADQAERLCAWIETLIGLAPEPANGNVPVAALVEACTRFLEEFAAKSSELDGAASVVLAESLQALMALGDAASPPHEAFRLVRHQLEALTVGSDRARPGHLFVTTLRHAGYSGRPYAFVVGLEEGRVFPVLLEDAVLLDDERAKISGALATSVDRASDALQAVVSRLAVLGGHVCLSYSCRDLRQYRETFPSWLLLQILRLLKPGRTWTYQELVQELGEPVSTVPAAPDRAISEAGWWVAHLKGAGQAALPAVHAAFPSLTQGAAAEAQRESDTFTVYDGLVRGAGPSLDPRVSGRAVSATTLEALARCPFRHFLERGLGIEAIEAGEPERDRWLDPATRGTMLHGLYAAIIREARDRKERVDPKRHGARLTALANAELVRFREVMPPPSEYVFERERREILDDLALFLRLEAGQKGCMPVGVEVSFGVGAAEGEPLAQVDALMIDLGGGLRFRLRGRIDRIDRLADGSYEVLDYKTGWYRPDDFVGTFVGGRLLQHALYALAATQLLRRRDPTARVSASGYYLPTARGQGERVICPPVAGDVVAAVLGDLFDVLAAGAFVHASDEDDCRWCHLGRACGRQSFARSQRKVEGNAVLMPYRRLAARE